MCGLNNRKCAQRGEIVQDIEFKGTKNGIILRYNPELKYDVFIAKLTNKLKAANRFFEGSHIIGIEGPEFDAEQESEITRLFKALGGMKVLTLERVQRIEKKASHSFPDKPPKKLHEGGRAAQSQTVQTAKKDDSAVDLKPLERCNETVIHRGTLRSGGRIESDADIVLLGDANPGSELSASGQIVVMGALRGFAQAGKNGDDSCFVVALKLQPTQLRIGNHITRPPDEAADGPDYAEIALVRDGQIIIEPYRK